MFSTHQRWVLALTALLSSGLLGSGCADDRLDRFSRQLDRTDETGGDAGPGGDFDQGDLDPVESDSPVAVARLRLFDPENPTAPFSDTDDIEPLDRVYFDGRAAGVVESSHDPQDPANPELIADYQWIVLSYPPGTNPDDFSFGGQGTGLADMFVPLAGHYEIKLVVYNAEGLSSELTDTSVVSFDAIPQDRLHLQLIWDNPTNDIDLQVTRPDHDDRVCTDDAVYWRNRQPLWFDEASSGQGPNPSLDRDDTDGLGPENINLEDPAPGLYRVFVHYYPGVDAMLTQCTVRVFVDGQLEAEFKRTLDYLDMWAVADVRFSDDGAAVISAYPNDGATQSGQVQTGAVKGGVNGCYNVDFD